MQIGQGWAEEGSAIVSPTVEDEDLLNVTTVSRSMQGHFQSTHLFRCFPVVRVLDDFTKQTYTERVAPQYGSQIRRQVDALSKVSHHGGGRWGAPRT